MQGPELRANEIEKAIMRHAAEQGAAYSHGVSFMMPVAAYVATLMSSSNEEDTFEEILEQGFVHSAVKDFLIETFSEPWRNVARALSYEFVRHELVDYTLHFDSATSLERASLELGTPECICKLALKILNIEPGERVADFGCGYGAFLTKVADEQPDADLYGIDINYTAICLTQIRMSLLCVRSKIEFGDMLHKAPDQAFDKIFANYPFGTRARFVSEQSAHQGSAEVTETGFGMPASADWLFNLQVFNSLVPGGKAVAIMTNGAAFNGGDKRARKYFIENGMIQAAVSLPGNLFKNTAIPTVLIVLGRSEGSVRFVDASDLSVPGRRWATMGNQEIDELLKRLHESGDHSRLVSRDELADADYSLFPPRFLGRTIALENPTPLGELAFSIERGVGLSAKQLDEMSANCDTGVGFLRLSDISDGYIGKDLLQIKGVDEKRLGQCLKSGNLVISKSGAPFKIAVVEVPDGQTILACGNLYVVRLDQSRVDPYYVAAFLTSEDGKEIMDKQVVGTALPNLPVKNLKSIQVPLIPLAEQRDVGKSYRAYLDRIAILKAELNEARRAAALVYAHAMADRV